MLVQKYTHAVHCPKKWIGFFHLVNDNLSDKLGREKENGMHIILKYVIINRLTVSMTFLASFVSVGSSLMQLSLIHFSTAFGLVSPRVVIFFVATTSVLSYLFVSTSQVSCSRRVCLIEPIFEAAVSPIAADTTRPMPKAAVWSQLDDSAGLLRSGICLLILTKELTLWSLITDHSVNSFVQVPK